MLRYLFEAEYEDGFVYKATQEDKSTVSSKRNAFFDVREGLSDQHGRMVRWSLLPQGGTRRLDIDFTAFPDNVKPIWYIKRKRETAVGSGGNVLYDIVEDTSYGFGYEYTDTSGRKVKEVKELV